MRQRQMLFGFLALIGTVFWVQFFLLGQLKAAARQGSELRKLEDQAARARRAAQQLPALEKELELLAGQSAVPGSSAPPQEQLPDLLERIAQAARAAHVRVVSLRPKQDLAQAGTGQGDYLEIPLELEANGGYHPAGRFLDSLEQSDCPIRLRELEIAPGNQDLWNHRVRILMQAYLGAASPAPGRAEYQSKGKRDPFVPLLLPDGRRLNPPETAGEEGMAGAGDALLQGIVYDPAGDSYVILNGHVLREKQEWGGIKLLKIEPNGATILKEGETHRLSLQRPTGKEKVTE